MIALVRHVRLDVTGLAFSIQHVAGAFVAGLDAGHAYNTFPTMNGRWVPDEYWAVPGWRNAFESTAAVQLHHRALALSTLAAVAALWAGHARAPLPPRARACLHYLLAATCAQVRPRLLDATVPLHQHNAPLLSERSPYGSTCAYQVGLGITTLLALLIALTSNVYC